MANELIQNLTDSLDVSLTAVKDALPKTFNKERFLQNTIAVIKQNPELQKYNKNELLTCMLRGSYLSLDFMAKECWLVPYNGHVTFQTSYKGECKFVKRYSIRPLLDVKAEIVRVGDEIDYGINEDNKPYIKYKPIPFNTQNVVGAFAVAYFKDGGILYEVMSMDEINKVRNVSRAASSSSSPWKTFPEEMYKKTVLRRLCKSIETDFDTVEQHEAWDEGSGVDFVNKPTPTEVHDPFAETDVVNEESESVVEGEIVSEVSVDEETVKEEIIAEAQEVFK